MKSLHLCRIGTSAVRDVSRRRPVETRSRQEPAVSSTFDGTKGKDDERRITTVAHVTASAVAPIVHVKLLEGSPSAITEERIEKVIYSCRFFALLGVSGSLAGSILCFLKGTICITTSFAEYFVCRGRVISMLIEGMDVYLIGTVMIVFGVGLYELFISNLDIAKMSDNRSSLFRLFMLQERPKWLEIKSVNELKTKLGHAIVMVLQVGLFEKSKKVVISSPADLLCFAASILVSSCGLYLLSKLKKKM